MLLSSTALKNASDLVELITLISSTKGLKDALDQIKTAQGEAEARLTEVVTRENAIAQSYADAQKQIDKAIKAEARAAEAKAEGDAAVEAAKLAAEALDIREAALTQEKKNQAGIAEELLSREQDIEDRSGKLDERDALIDAREEALDARERELNEREQKLRTALGV